MGRTAGATALPIGVAFACAALHAGGYGYREISRLLGRSPTAVRRAVEAFKLPAATGTTPEDVQHRTTMIALMQWVNTGIDQGYFRAMKSLKANLDTGPEEDL